MQLIKNINMKISAEQAPELKELFVQRAQKAKEVEALDQQIIRAAHATPFYLILKGMVGAGQSMGTPKITASHVEYKLGATQLGLYDKDDMVSYFGPTGNDTRPNIRGLGEKTLNMLLGGKLLTDAEKRKVIGELTNGSVGELPSKPEVETDDTGLPF